MNPGDFTPAPRRSTVEHIAAELRHAIMQGTLAPGAQLGEADLAQRFSVSRGPLREAMQRLVSEGILEAITNRGVFVRELTLADVVDIHSTRSVIERGAVEAIHAQGRATVAHQTLAPIVDRMRAAAEAGDGPAVSDADRAFHEALVACSGSERLMRAMRTLVVETRMCLSELRTTYDSLDTHVIEHAQLHEALLDADRMPHLLAAHLQDAVERLTDKRGGE